MSKTERAVTFVEVDIPYCALRYGEATCTASGGPKCFNTYATCQDRENFDESTVTLRFAKASDYLEESGVEAIPSILNVKYDPAVLSLGERSLGTRAKLTVQFRDHLYGDTGLGYDKYHAERDYDASKQGSYWGRLRARHPILDGRAIRYITGYVGQSLEQMETHHLLIDGMDTAEDGRFTLVGKDILKLADGDRALAPRPSGGYLLADITSSATSAELGPSGIGNAEYPASGFLSLGSKEIVGFTRSGDTLTLIRAQSETEAVAHSAQDRAQICLHFPGWDPADIIHTLLVDYADTPPAYIPLDDWKDETGTFLRRVYTALIPEPTPVKELTSELVEQAALVLIPDDIERQIRLQVLRSISTEAALWDEGNIGKSSLRIKDQPDKRITNCITYYGLINPLENVDDPKNYRSIEAFDATDFDVEKQARIKRIYSRWIPAFGRTVAARVNMIQIGRYRSAPRRFTFDIFRTATAVFGRGYRLEYWPLQLPDGMRDSIPIQVVSLRSDDAWHRLECEEVRFVDLDEEDLANRVIIIDGSANNLNLRSVHDSLFPALQPEDTVTFIINSGVTVGSTSTALPAIDVGDWPGGVVPTIRLRGRIQGTGGRGGRFTPGDTYISAQPGGPALFARTAVTLEIDGQLWGGGGGGAGFRAVGNLGGGGGAGTLPGQGGSGNPTSAGGEPGTATSGGLGGIGAFGSQRASSGGDPGQAGHSNYQASGAGPGAAIDGVSFITFVGSGDIRGPQVG